MIRQEFDSLIVSKLGEIREIVREFNPEIKQVSMCVMPYYRNAFALSDDGKGLYFDVTYFDEEDNDDKSE